MLSKDDLSMYKDKETFLNGLRSKRQPDSASNGGTTSPGETLRGTVPVNSINSGGYESQGSGAPSTVYGGNGSSQGGTGSSGGFAERLRRNREFIARGDGGVHQLERPATQSGQSVWNTLKSTAGRYREAFTSDTPKNVGSQKPTKKIEGKKLTDTETVKLRPKLIEYLTWQTEHMDQFIIATTVGHDHDIEIWSDLSEAEIEILADFLLNRGKQDIRTANTVRYISEIMDKIKLGIILAPRVYRTIMIYIERGFSIGPIYRRHGGY